MHIRTDRRGQGAVELTDVDQHGQIGTLGGAAVGAPGRARITLADPGLRVCSREAGLLAAGSVGSSAPHGLTVRCCDDDISQLLCRKS